MIFAYHISIVISHKVLFLFSGFLSLATSASHSAGRSAALAICSASAPSSFFQHPGTLSVVCVLSII